MYDNIPVRSDAFVWTPCKDEEYAGREIYESPMIQSTERTTTIEEVILKDPNIDPQHLPANYRGTVSKVQTTLDEMFKDGTVAKIAQKYGISEDALIQPK